MAQAAAPPTALLGPRASVCSPPHAAPIRGSGSGASSVVARLSSSAAPSREKTSAARTRPGPPPWVVDPSCCPSCCCCSRRPLQPAGWNGVQAVRPVRWRPAKSAPPAYPPSPAPSSRPPRRVDEASAAARRGADGGAMVLTGDGEGSGGEGGGAGSGTLRGGAVASGGACSSAAGGVGVAGCREVGCGSLGGGAVGGDCWHVGSRGVATGCGAAGAWIWKASPARISGGIRTCMRPAGVWTCSGIPPDMPSGTSTDMSIASVFREGSDAPHKGRRARLAASGRAIRGERARKSTWSNIYVVLALLAYGGM
mmetsp:Transcript_38329/g.125380  ORF Transcript_38329/g.125380 Transcript_38329/m.125380 type:complete len:311 (+) Transcript_38329:176-1108(+)